MAADMKHLQEYLRGHPETEDYFAELSGMDPKEAALTLILAAIDDGVIQDPAPILTAAVSGFDLETAVQLVAAALDGEGRIAPEVLEEILGEEPS